MNDNIIKLTKEESALFIKFMRKSPEQVKKWIKTATQDDIAEMERISAKALVGKMLFGDDFFDDETNYELTKIHLSREMRNFEDEFNSALSEVPEMEVLNTEEATEYLKKFTLGTK